MLSTYQVGERPRLEQIELNLIVSVGPGRTAYLPALAGKPVRREVRAIGIKDSDRHNLVSVRTPNIIWPAASCIALNLEYRKRPGGSQEDMPDKGIYPCLPTVYV